MKTYIAGTAIYISVLVPDDLESITIKIVNEGESTIVDTVDMTIEPNLSSSSVKKIYDYTFESTESLTEGIYTALITAVYNGKTSVQQVQFRLKDRY